MTDRRSRKGCLQCRQQHRKCDETRPCCTRCARRGVSCDFSRELRWTRPQKPASKGRLHQHGQAVASQQDETAPIVSLPRLGSDDSLVTFEPSALSPQSGILNQNGGSQEEIPDARDAALSLGHLVTNGNDSVGKMTDEIEEISPSQHALSRQNFSDVSEGWIYNSELFGNSCLEICGTPGERLAYAFFLQFVSRIIPAYDGPKSGYRELAALALTSPVLMDTVLSVATRYMSQNGGASIVLALSRQSRALKTLRESLPSLLASGTNNHGGLTITKDWSTTMKQEILAAIALQMTIEMLAGSGEVKTHLNSAVNLLDDLGYLAEKTDSSIGRILVNRIAFIDICSSILWRRRPLLPLSFWFFQPDDRYDTSTPSVRDMTGCPHRIVCFLAEISHLVADNEPGVMSKAYEIETNLRHYASTQLDPKTSQPGQFEEVHLHTLARCYYWTALLLLQRRACCDPRTSPRVQFAVNNLISLIDSMPIGCGPDSSLSLCLYVAAQDAIYRAQQDRIIARGRRLAEEYPSRTREMMNDSFEAMWNSMDELGSTDASYHPDEAPVQDLVRSEGLFIC